MVDDPAGVHLANGSEFAPSAGAEPTLETQEAAISFWDKVSEPAAAAEEEEDDEEQAAADASSRFLSD